MDFACQYLFVSVIRGIEKITQIKDIGFLGAPK